MYIVPETTITADMVASNNATDAEAEWDSGTAYTESDIVSAGGRRWEAVTGSTGQDPESDDGTYWLDIGPTNSTAFLDDKVSTRTTRATSLTIELELGQLFNAVVLFNLTGGSVTVEMDDGDGTTQFSETRTLVDSDVNDFWDYAFTEPTFRTVAIFPSVPGFSDWTLRVTVTGTTAGLGKIVAGRQVFAGRSLAGSGPRFKDYSKVTFDEDFGDFTRVIRDYATGAMFEVGFDPEATDRFMRFLARTRGTVVAAYPGDDMERYGLTVIGFLAGFEPGLIHRGIVPVTIEVKGIT